MSTPYITTSLFELSGGTPIIAPVQWISGLLLGEVGVTLSVIAVGVTGLLLLTGRIAWGNAVRVVLGCAIVLSAPVVAAGLIANTERDEPRLLQRSYDRPGLTARESLPAAQERSGASLRRD